MSSVASSDCSMAVADAAGRWRLTLHPSRGLTALGLDSESGDRGGRNILAAAAQVAIDGVALRAEHWDLTGERGCCAIKLDGGDSITWVIGRDGEGFTWSLSYTGGRRDSELRVVLPIDPLQAAAVLLPQGLDAENLGTGPWMLVAPDLGHLRVEALSPLTWRTLSTGRRALCKTTRLPSRGVDPALRGSEILQAAGITAAEYEPGELHLTWIGRGEWRPGLLLNLRFAPQHLAAPEHIDIATWRRIRRPYLNHWQPCGAWTASSRWHVLANNVLSDPASCSLHFYAEPLLFHREPVPGLDLAHLLRHSLDYWIDGHISYFGHVNAFDMDGWPRFDLYLFTNAVLISAAWTYWKITGDIDWLQRHLFKLNRVGDFLSRRDVDHDGLVESLNSGNANSLRQPDRADVWFEMVNFGWKNAYTNALTYRAWLQLAQLLRACDHGGGAERYRELAATLRKAFNRQMLSDRHGWVVSWISQDGQVHDYGHTFVNGMAVAYGLIDPLPGRTILAGMVQQLHASGFGAWHLGVPANLIPIRRADMIAPPIDMDGQTLQTFHPLYGWPQSLSDEQMYGRRYANGTVHPALVFPYLLGLQVAGLHEEADRILSLMIDSAQRGLLQNGIVGFMPLGADHFDQDGCTCGYEGYLPENFNVLMAAFTRCSQQRERYRSFLE